jgi:hypothetical protein
VGVVVGGHQLFCWFFSIGLRSSSGVRSIEEQASTWSGKLLMALFLSLVGFWSNPRSEEKRLSCTFLRPWTFAQKFYTTNIRLSDN